VCIHQLLLQQLQPSQQHITCITLAGTFLTPTAPAVTAAVAAVIAMLATAAISDSRQGIASAADAVSNTTTAAAPCLAGVLLLTVPVSGASIWLFVRSHNRQQHAMNNSSSACGMLLLLQGPLLYKRQVLTLLLYVRLCLLAIPCLQFLLMVAAAAAAAA
jgi:hypothetical protein